MWFQLCQKSVCKISSQVFCQKVKRTLTSVVISCQECWGWHSPAPTGTSCDPLSHSGLHCPVHRGQLNQWGDMWDTSEPQSPSRSQRLFICPPFFPWTAVGVSARLTQSRAWGPWIFVVSPVECHYWVFQICDHAPAPCQLYLFIFGLFRCKSAAHCKFPLSQDAIDFKSMRAKAWVLRVFASVHDMKDFKWL